MTQRLGFGLSLLVASFFGQPATAAENRASLLPDSGHLVAARDGAGTPAKPNAPAVHPKRANFEGELASPESRNLADWVVDSGDNRSMPFVIVDKAQAKVFVFHADGRLRGAAPTLLGLARGDDSVPGIGTRKMSSILPEERTTPAGRFVASLDRNLHGVEILWVDYDTA
ncbi:MAG: hypothetical protein ABIQ90_02115, partial [Polaromonas sp.]